MLKWHKNYGSRTYILSKTKYFHIVVGWSFGVVTDLDNEGEIFIFRSSFYVIINQYEIFDKKVPTLIIPKNYWLNTN